MQMVVFTGVAGVADSAVSGWGEPGSGVTGKGVGVGGRLSTGVFLGVGVLSKADKKPSPKSGVAEGLINI